MNYLTVHDALPFYYENQEVFDLEIREQQKYADEMRKIEAFSAKEENNLGLSDEKQLKYVVIINACLFTYDTDFFRISDKWEM